MFSSFKEPNEGDNQKWNSKEQRNLIFDWNVSGKGAVNDANNEAKSDYGECEFESAEVGSDIIKLIFDSVFCLFNLQQRINFEFVCIELRTY